MWILETEGMEGDVSTTMKPRLLDLFCGAGGTSVGYARAGFEVVGVDIVPQPRYPYAFHQADALTFPLEGFDAYAASPLCQGFTQMLNWNEQQKDKYPNYIGIIRERFLATGKPYIIENVEGARASMINPIMLCGLMFGLRVYRHRLFESNVFLFAHSHIKHRIKAAHSGKIARSDQFWCPVGNFGHKGQEPHA
jgi:DNA (cytosine-5)-methyltransferase 1